MTTPTPADALHVERLLALHHPLATLDPAVQRCCACEGGACVAHNDGRDTTEWPCDFERLRAALSPQPEVSVTQSDPIETFSHPYRPPVAIDGHLFTHTSDCDWPAALAESPVTPDLRAALHRAFDDEFGTDRDQAYGADEVHDLIDRALASPDPEAGS